jgi:hypothetical protein
MKKKTKQKMKCKMCVFLQECWPDKKNFLKKRVPLALNPTVQQLHCSKRDSCTFIVVVPPQSVLLFLLKNMAGQAKAETTNLPCPAF